MNINQHFGLVEAYDKNSKQKLWVPAHWLEQEIFPNIAPVPSSKRGTKSEPKEDPKNSPKE